MSASSCLLFDMPGAFNKMELLPGSVNNRDGPCTLGTTSKGKRPLRALSASDKIDAIQRVNDGESKASVARDIGVPESTLRGWCKNEDKLRYMSSRHSTPDTDKSSDGMTENMVPEKRAKYDILNYSHNANMGSIQYPDTSADLSMQPTTEENGLDLSRVKKDDTDIKQADMVHADFSSYTRSTLELSKNMSDLNKYNNDLMNSTMPKESKQKMDAGVNMSMSAISPLSGLNHLSGLSGLGQSHLGLSFNEIATNLSLIAQLNPSLSALTNSISTNSKALRSIRSPKPSHNSTSTGMSSGEKHKSSKSHHHSDPYGDKSRSSRSSHNSYKDIPMDDTLWYWFKKQQAMLNLASNSSTPNPLNMQHTLPSSRSNKDQYPSTHTSKPVNTLPPVVPPLDSLNKNSWFWQYYKQFTGNLGLPEGKHSTEVSAPLKAESYENILYSHLTKEKMESLMPQEEASSTLKADKKIEETLPEACTTPPLPIKDQAEKEAGKSNTKVRAVLDNLLFNNNNNDVSSPKQSPDIEDGEKDSNTENEFGGEVNEALEHGEKFLKWLEACQEPSVTRMQVHQLKGLLNNIKANAERRNQNGNMKDRVSRRK